LADKYIKVQAISGFTEYLPGEQIAFNRTRELIERVYQRYGFTPLETPAVERWEILTAKSGIDRQIYSVGKPEAPAHGEAEPSEKTSQSKFTNMTFDQPELGLRFDLTVPLARFVAQHANDLTFPFRRYQIQPVWRGERPQQGRFRQFYQADIDVIGSGELDPIYEAEVLCVINDAFKALTFMPEVKVHISNRKILTGLCVDYGISARAAEVLREVDKAQRDGAQAVKDAVTRLLARDMPAGFESLLSELVGGIGADIKALNKILKGRSQALAGVAELDRVHKAAVSLGVPSDRLIIDPTIARGLDYYTGTVYETIVTGFDQWGSVCSGGRYDDLASYFTTQRYPGVGVSIGLSRLVDLLMKNGMLKAERKSVADVLVTMQDRAAFLDKYLAIARSLRDAGINTEVFSDDARLMKQLGYGGRIGIPFAVVAGGDEFTRNTAKVRDLATREEKEFSLAELASGITAMLRERQGKV
jgi:histidyl-tRNA synthetase